MSSDNEADHENGNDDNDNVFRSGSESPGFSMVQSLPVFEETKQRRATVSGGRYICFSRAVEEL